jgi:hypothetical protein
VSGAPRLRRLTGTLMAIGAGWAIWNASASVADVLNWPELLPLVRLGVVVAGITALEYVFAAMRPLLGEQHASGSAKGAGE